jgi:hypothetical protein
VSPLSSSGFLAGMLTSIRQFSGLARVASASAISSRMIARAQTVNALDDAHPIDIGCVAPVEILPGDPRAMTRKSSVTDPRSLPRAGAVDTENGTTRLSRDVVLSDLMVRSATVLTSRSQDEALRPYDVSPFGSANGRRIGRPNGQSRSVE